MNRFPDWQERLACFFRLHRNRPFCYGKWDCCLFAADAIQVTTSVDIADGFRGTYSTRSAAYALLKDNFGGPSVRSFAEQVAAKHFMPQTPVSYGQRGDMVLIRRARDYSLGIISLTGKEIVVLRAQSIMTIPLSYGLAAWHV